MFSTILMSAVRQTPKFWIVQSLFATISILTISSMTSRCPGRAHDPGTNTGLERKCQKKGLVSKFLLFYLEKLLRFPGRFIIMCPSLEVILIFFAVHVGVNHFARQTVRLITHWTMESIDIVLVHTPSLTIWSFTMKAVGGLTFRSGEATVQELVEIFRREKLHKQIKTKEKQFTWKYVELSSIIPYSKIEI